MREIPSNAYTQASFLRLERSELFAKAWVAVGRADELPEAGSHFTWERTRVPFLIVRSVDKVVRGLYNSCRHRGAPVVRAPCGRSRAFRCQYHSWTYDTFGKLVALPDERDFGDMNRETYSLVPLRLEERGGWLFVNQKKDAAPLADLLGDAAPALDRFGEGLHFGDREVVRVESNWKAVLERLSDMIHLGQIPGEEVLSLTPNMIGVRGANEARVMMAWPQDERTTDLEVVRCVGDGAVDMEAWRANGLRLRDQLRDATDHIPTSGARTEAGRARSRQLAAELSRRVGEDRLSAVVAGTEALATHVLA